LKDKTKENNSESNKRGRTGRKRLFAYSFFIMDIKIKMYVAFGSSMNSEGSAFDRTLEMPRSAGRTLS
jgi:transposase